MNKVYLLLGSNQQDPQKQLRIAQRSIIRKVGRTQRRSAIYQTAAWGNTDQPDFLNQVIIVQTKLTAEQTMQAILQIEKEMGRLRTVKNAPRIIDIDILFFNKEIINTAELTVPHPQLQNRRFVLVPLNELSPNFKHPILKKNMHRLFIHCTDKLNVKKF